MVIGLHSNLLNSDSSYAMGSALTGSNPVVVVIFFPVFWMRFFHFITFIRFKTNGIAFDNQVVE